MSFSDPMFKNNELQNKVIVVTGGGSGLGKSMSEYFLSLGAKVVITSRNMDKLNKEK
ncbi:MAG: short-chain dehydrogenase, partial [Marinilabiliales bacterium]